MFTTSQKWSSQIGAQWTKKVTATVSNRWDSSNPSRQFQKVCACVRQLPSPYLVLQRVVPDSNFSAFSASGLMPEPSHEPQPREPPRAPPHFPALILICQSINPRASSASACHGLPRQEACLLFLVVAIVAISMLAWTCKAKMSWKLSVSNHMTHACTERHDRV